MTAWERDDEGNVILPLADGYLVKLEEYFCSNMSCLINVSSGSSSSGGDEKDVNKDSQSSLEKACAGNLPKIFWLHIPEPDVYYASSSFWDIYSEFGDIVAPGDPGKDDIFTDSLLEGFP